MENNKVVNEGEEMKMKRTVAFFTGVAAYVAIAILLTGYGNVYVHRSMNEAIVNGFNNKFIASALPLQKFSNYIIVYDGSLGMKGPAVTQGGYLEAVESQKSYNLKKWVEEGGYSADEPALPASFRHFYDPTQQPGERYLKDHLEYLENKLSLNFNPRIDQIEWAVSHNDHAYNWNKGIAYVKAALESADQEERNENMAKAYRCLGETLHMIADLGCPPHVRDDSHPAPFNDYTALSYFGSPDPYEELFEKIYGDISGWAGTEPDGILKSFFRSAGTVETIAHRLAVYTNENFFTNQTISGYGVMPQIHPEKTYASPTLDQCTYHQPSYTFKKTISGNEVLMCKDLTYFWGLIPDRGYPYIDFDCVVSQGQTLVPQILEAGANVIRLFIPELEVRITSFSNNFITGSVIHKTDSVYQEQILYNGKVDIYDQTTMNKLGSVDASNGSFSGQVNAGTDAKVYAQIGFGDITVKSPPFSGASYRAFNISLDVWGSYTWTNKNNGQVTYGEEGIGGFSTPLEIPLIRNGNVYTASWTGMDFNGSASTGTATITFLEDNNVILEYYETSLWPAGNPTVTTSRTLVANQGFPLYESWGTYDVYVTEGNVYDYIQTVAISEDWPEKYYTFIPVSNPAQPGYIRLVLYY